MHCHSATTNKKVAADMVKNEIRGEGAKNDRKETWFNLITSFHSHGHVFYNTKRSGIKGSWMTQVANWGKALANKINCCLATDTLTTSAIWGNYLSDQECKLNCKLIMNQNFKRSINEITRKCVAKFHCWLI